MKKILWVKFGWSEFYSGGPVNGNFRWLKRQRRKKKPAPGHERFNFRPDSSGTYCCYVPPQGRAYAAPWNDDNSNWTVVCLAKRPGYKGIHVVGWYENAKLLGERMDRGDTEDCSYCITSNSVFFIRPEDRVLPFSHRSVAQSMYSFLAGPGVNVTQNKKRVLALLEHRLTKLREIAIHNPTDVTSPDPEADPVDPLKGFGTPEHRKQVEEAAEEAVVAHYKAKGFSAKDVTKEKRGYDFIFTKKRTIRLVEVKGTSGARERFFFTRNEDAVRTDPRWRIAIVTDALIEPNVTIYDDEEFSDAFDLAPYVYIGSRIVEP